MICMIHYNPRLQRTYSSLRARQGVAISCVAVRRPSRTYSSLRARQGVAISCVAVRRPSRTYSSLRARQGVAISCVAVRRPWFMIWLYYSAPRLQREVLRLPRRHVAPPRNDVSDSATIRNDVFYSVFPLIQR